MDSNEYDEDYDEYEDDNYPCDNCSLYKTCDYWDAKACSTLNDYCGIEDYDPWDV